MAGPPVINKGTVQAAGSAGRPEQTDAARLRQVLRDRFFRDQGELQQKQAIGELRRKIAAVPSDNAASPMQSTEEREFDGTPNSDGGAGVGGTAREDSQRRSAVPSLESGPTAAEKAQPLASSAPRGAAPASGSREAAPSRIKQLADNFEQGDLVDLCRRANLTDQLERVLASLDGIVSIFSPQGGIESDPNRKSVRESLSRASHPVIHATSLRYYELLNELRSRGPAFTLNVMDEQRLVVALVQRLNNKVFGMEVVICETNPVPLDESRHCELGERAPGSNAKYRPMSFGIRSGARVEPRILVVAMREGGGS